MPTVNTVEALFLAASLYIRFKDPATGQFSNPKFIEVDKFEVNTPSDKKTAISKARESYGQSHTTLNVPKPTEFSITFTQMSREIFAMMLSGSQQVIDRTVEAISKDVTLVPGEWVSVGYRNIDPAGFTVASTGAGSTSYAKDVDYEFNPRLGLLKALPSPGKITGAVHVTGNTLHVTGTAISAANSYTHTLKIEGDAINQINQRNVYFSAGKATVSADKAKDFLSGDIDKLELKGLLEIPPEGGAPFVMEIYD